MKCNECGKENPDVAKFCKWCGKELLEINKSDVDLNNIPEENSDNVKINNGSIQDWFLPILYWYDNQNNEYKLSKTKIISILVFLYFVYAQLTGTYPIPLPGAIILSLIITIPVFLIGMGIHILLNR